MYWLAANNEDCPISELITTESECTVAAEKLGIIYAKAVEKYIRPAGCYTIFEGTSAAYFNKIIDPSSTSPDSSSAGICRSGSIAGPRVIFFSYPKNIL